MNEDFNKGILDYIFVISFWNENTSEQETHYYVHHDVAFKAFSEWKKLYSISDITINSVMINTSEPE